jgi:hypothetical protein
VEVGGVSSFRPQYPALATANAAARKVASQSHQLAKGGFAFGDYD